MEQVLVRQNICVYVIRLILTLVQLTLTVHYTDAYPDELPDLSLDAIEGELEDDELQSLLNELCTVVRPCQFTTTPLLIGLTGRGKPRDGYDIHSSVSSERATFISSTRERRKYSQGGEGEGTASFGGMEY